MRPMMVQLLPSNINMGWATVEPCLRHTGEREGCQQFGNEMKKYYPQNQKLIAKKKGTQKIIPKICKLGLKAFIFRNGWEREFHAKNYNPSTTMPQ